MAVSLRQVASLLVRARNMPDVVTVNGVPCTPIRLGHNAPQARGYHPYLIPTGIETPVGRTVTLDLDAGPARLTRLLVVITTDSGGPPI